MAEFTALDALTAPEPTERQWVIRCAAELLCGDATFRDEEKTPKAARMAAIMASGQLGGHALSYLADLTPMAWTRISVDILTCVDWAIDNQWEF